ncbi:MAG TPA: hypothetical protein VE487_00035, partial [Ilumatobacter sp.]|nr:hypothetical protein [Ilumatobacter sp.]
MSAASALAPIEPWSHRRRIAQLVRLRVAERILSLANTHLASGDARARLPQARRLLGCCNRALSWSAIST